jgi:hypothetical protein
MPTTRREALKRFALAGTAIAVKPLAAWGQDGSITVSLGKLRV